MTSLRDGSEIGGVLRQVDGEISRAQRCDDCGEESNVLVECSRCSQSICLTCSAKHAIKHGAIEGAPDAGYINVSALPCWVKWISSMQPDLLVAPPLVVATLPWLTSNMSSEQVIKMASQTAEPIFDRAVLIAANVDKMGAAIGAMQILAKEVIVVSQQKLPNFFALKEAEKWLMQKWPQEDRVCEEDEEPDIQKM